MIKQKMTVVSLFQHLVIPPVLIQPLGKLWHNVASQKISITFDVRVKLSNVSLYRDGPLFS
jgi:hypothetical protein